MRPAYSSRQTAAEPCRQVDRQAFAAERFAAASGATLHDVVPAWGPKGPALARSFWSAHETRLQAYLPQWEAQMDPGLVACIRSGATVTMSAPEATWARAIS